MISQGMNFLGSLLALLVLQPCQVDGEMLVNVMASALDNGCVNYPPEVIPPEGEFLRLCARGFVATYEGATTAGENVTLVHNCADDGTCTCSSPSNTLSGGFNCNSCTICVNGEQDTFPFNLTCTSTSNSNTKRTIGGCVTPSPLATLSVSCSGNGCNPTETCTELNCNIKGSLLAPVTSQPFTTNGNFTIGYQCYNDVLVGSSLRSCDCREFSLTTDDQSAWDCQCEACPQSKSGTDVQDFPFYVVCTNTTGMKKVIGKPCPIYTLDVTSPQEPVCTTPTCGDSSCPGFGCTFSASTAQSPSTAVTVHYGCIGANNTECSCTCDVSGFDVCDCFECDYMSIPQDLQGSFPFKLDVTNASKTQEFFVGSCSNIAPSPVSPPVVAPVPTPVTPPQSTPFAPPSMIGPTMAYNTTTRCEGSTCAILNFPNGSTYEFCPDGFTCKLDTIVPTTGAPVEIYYGCKGYNINRILNGSIDYDLSLPPCSCNSTVSGNGCDCIACPGTQLEDVLKTPLPFLITCANVPVFQTCPPYTPTGPVNPPIVSPVIQPPTTPSVPVQQPVAPVPTPVAPVTPPVAPVPTPVAPVPPPVAPVEPPVAPVEPPVAPVDPPVAPVEPPTTPSVPVQPPVAPMPTPFAPVTPPVAPVPPPVAPVEPPVAPVEPPVAPVEPPVAPVEPPVAPVEPPVAPVPISQPVTPVAPSPVVVPIAPVAPPVVAPSPTSNKVTCLPSDCKTLRYSNGTEYEFCSQGLQCTLETTAPETGTPLVVSYGCRYMNPDDALSGKVDYDLSREPCSCGAVYGARPCNCRACFGATNDNVVAGQLPFIISCDNFVTLGDCTGINTGLQQGEEGSVNGNVATGSSPSLTSSSMTDSSSASPRWSSIYSSILAIVLLASVAIVAK